MFICSRDQGLKWCDRCWLIRSHWLCSKSSHRVASHWFASLMRHFNLLLSVERTFSLLECTECRVSRQCSWAADKFLESCSLTPISNKREVWPTYCLSHCLQWISKTVSHLLRLNTIMNILQLFLTFKYLLWLTKFRGTGRNIDHFHKWRKLQILLKVLKLAFLTSFWS